MFGKGSLSNNIVRDNEVYNNGSFGILIGSGNNNIAYNNIVYGNGRLVSGSGGMRIAYNGATGNKIYNNTIYNNTGDCVSVVTDGNAQVKNNICWQNSSNIIADQTGTAVRANNLF